MKKLFASLMAATMVAGMSVSAFAYTTAEVAAADAGVKATDLDYALFVKNGAVDKDGAAVTELEGGDKAYYPILVSENELEITGAGANEFRYATKASEVEDLAVKLDVETGSKYVKAATIVKKNITGVAGGEKIYMVEVEMADYFGEEAKEVEFNLTLKNNGRVVFETEEDADNFKSEFELGKDSKVMMDATEAAKVAGTPSYKKFRNNEITLEINDKTGVVALDEAYKPGETTGGAKEDIEFIYLEGKDANFTFDVKASSQDDLYLELNQDAVKEIAVANGKADLTFFNFPGKPEFDFAGTAKFGVEDEDEDNFFYEIVDGKLVETKATYNEEDGVFELRTNKLGSYVISDKELDTATAEEEANDKEDKEEEVTGGKEEEAATPSVDGEKVNANTGAADLIGVASALAVVSVAAAGVVALKK